MNAAVEIYVEPPPPYELVKVLIKFSISQMSSEVMFIPSLGLAALSLLQPLLSPTRSEENLRYHLNPSAYKTQHEDRPRVFPSTSLI
jgi:hypothetical protein